MTGIVRWITVSLIGVLAGSVLSLSYVEPFSMRIALMCIPSAMLLTGALVVAFVVKPHPVPFTQRNHTRGAKTMQIAIFSSDEVGDEEKQLWEGHVNKFEDYMSQVLRAGVKLDANNNLVPDEVPSIGSLLTIIEEHKRDASLWKQEASDAKRLLDEARNVSTKQFVDSLHHEVDAASGLLLQFTAEAQALIAHVQAAQSQPTNTPPQKQKPTRKPCWNCTASKDALAPYEEHEYQLASGKTEKLWLCSRCRPKYEKFLVQQPAQGSQGKKKQATAAT